MVITVDRDSNIFPPSICDLINIKSQRLNALVDMMDVPPISYKENIKPLQVNFNPVEIITTAPAIDQATGKEIPGGVMKSTLRIGSMANHSIQIGDVYQVNIMFDDIFAETRFSIPGQEDTTVPYFVTESFKTLAKIDRMPPASMYFRAFPINPSKKENPAVKSEIGSASLFRVKDESYLLDFKGLLYDKAKLPLFFFFIK